METPMSIFDLSGRVAVITGGNGGIGLGIAQALTAAGCNVSIWGRNAEKNKAAAATFEKFSPSHRKEYIEWITEARRDETRQKRLSTTLEWLAEGKSRNWKYENC